MAPPAENDPDPDPAPPPALWADGAFSLLVRPPGRGSPRPATVGRCFALLGRIAGADVPIDDPAVSARHAYLHLDRRGLFAVDLATRSGTRVGPSGGASGWLGPGQALEVAGYRVEVLSCRVDGVELERAAPGDDDDPLADAGPAPLARVALHPTRGPDAPLVLGSELVFLGRSPSCGVRIEGESASRTHCVLVRSRRGAFVVDLVGRGTWLNGRPLRGGAPLADGDTLMVGSAQFDVRVEPPWARGTALATARAQPPPPAELAAAPPGPATELLELPPLPPGLVSQEDQAALLGWMMGILQAGQAEILRQQSEFQRSMALLVRQLHQDNSSLLARHMERVEAINRELAMLREEIRRRFGAGGPPGRPAAPALPQAAPLRVAPHTPPADPGAATSWLLDRVNKLEQESRSTWKDLLGRLNGPARRGP